MYATGEGIPPAQYAAALAVAEHQRERELRRIALLARQRREQGADAGGAGRGWSVDPQRSSGSTVDGDGATGTGLVPLAT